MLLIDESSVSINSWYDIIKLKKLDFDRVITLVKLFCIGLFSERDIDICHLGRPAES